MTTLTICIVCAFVIGYLCIALESLTKVNKAAIALLMCVVCWTLLMMNPSAYYPEVAGDSVIHHISEVIEHHLGDAAGTLFFLMGAMTIVEIVDSNGGFNFVRDALKTRSKRKLMWRVAFMTFFLSAILDNLTTSIVMIMVLRKLVQSREERLLYAALIIISANSGGAFSPIGDVTTIMLWIAGKVSTGNIITATFLPSAISLLIPLTILSFIMKGEIQNPQGTTAEDTEKPLEWQRKLFLILGVSCLVGVPVFKTLTHLPPYIGMMGGLSILWVTSEIIHRSTRESFNEKYAITNVITRVDVPSILFFLGILLAVNALGTVGHLSLFANGLDSISLGEPHKYYSIGTIIGIMSSIVDNVPLVAATMGMYDFPLDHYFWSFIAYCAGTGGSLLIIGSAAGVAVMGMEKIDFIWYLKHISWIAIVGYLAGVLTFIAQHAIMGLNM